jgi:diadenosine tetraphosphate (Ap4A) HIT family hydrolase
MTVEIDPAFLATSQVIAELSLCQARLQDDGRYPWIVLIPRVAGAQELEDLSEADRALLMEEIVTAGEAVRAMGKPLGLAVEKLNVGALGNVTAQLHVHVVGRRRSDPAWPGPVWGYGQAEPLSVEQRAAALAAGRAALAATGA